MWVDVNFPTHSLVREQKNLDEFKGRELLMVMSLSQGECLELKF
jgi:hypothetical protein